MGVGDYLARPPMRDKFMFWTYMSSNAAAGAVSRKSMNSYEPLEPRTVSFESIKIPE